MAYPERPHFAWPFGRDASGRVAVNEQHTPEHVNSQIYAVISTPVNFRVERPDFGWPFPEFAMVPLDLTALAAAIHSFVPEATFSISEWADAASQAIRHVRIEEEL